MVEFQLPAIAYTLIPCHRIHEVTDIFQHIHPGVPNPEFRLHASPGQLEMGLQPYLPQDFLLHQVYLILHHVLPQDPIEAIGGGTHGGRCRSAHRQDPGRGLTCSALLQISEQHRRTMFAKPGIGIKSGALALIFQDFPVVFIYFNLYFIKISMTAVHIGFHGNYLEAVFFSLCPLQIAHGAPPAQFLSLFKGRLMAFPTDICPTQHNLGFLRCFHVFPDWSRYCKNRIYHTIF